MFLNTLKYGAQLVWAFGFQPIRHKYAIFSFEVIKGWRLHRLRYDLSLNMTSTLAIKFPVVVVIKLGKKRRQMPWVYYFAW